MCLVLSVQIDAASLSPHALLFQDQEIGGHLLLSLPHLHIFFVLLAISLLTMQSAVMKSWVMKSYCCGPQALTLLSDTEFPFSIMLLLLKWLIFGLGSRIVSDLEQKGSYCFSARSLYKYEVFIFVIFHWLSTNNLSFNSLLTCKICSKYFRSTGILLVNFFVSSPILFSALTEVKWLSSLCIFSLCLLPLQCCLLLGGSYLLLFLLMFLPCYCFNNVKSQVLACYL